jgi:hypothetical protein
MRECQTEVMPFRFILCPVLFLLSTAVGADVPVPVVPSTPAGHALTAWLDAFNSGDRDRINAYDEAHIAWLTLDDAMDMHKRTGGYELLGVGKSGTLWITFSAREKGASAPISGALVVEPDTDGVISLLMLNPAGPEPDEIKLSAAQRDQVIKGAARKFADGYVFPDRGRSVADTLEERRKRGDYRDINNGEILASRLTDDIRAISHDKHVGVHFSWDVVPPDPPANSDTPDAHQDIDPELKVRLEARNCGFEKAEHLPPNIGYLKFNEFADPAICAATAAAAMGFVADSDALIIDLRDNHGGRPEMVTQMASHFFAVPTHLNDVYSRSDNSTRESWTTPNVSGKRFLDKPVYLLTSRQTFSAAEDFSYALKNVKRATVIGETTGGGAHPIGPYRINDHYFIIVPIGRSISPITKTDWEGTGVEPDIKVPAADALGEALKRVRDQAEKTGSPG